MHKLSTRMASTRNIRKILLTIWRNKLPLFLPFVVDRTFQREFGRFKKVASKVLVGDWRNFSMGTCKTWYKLLAFIATGCRGLSFSSLDRPCPPSTSSVFILTAILCIVPKIVRVKWFDWSNDSRMNPEYPMKILLKVRGVRGTFSFPCKEKVLSVNLTLENSFRFGI